MALCLSLVLTLLQLAAPLCVLAVYEHAIGRRDMGVLAQLTAVAVAVHLSQAFLDMVRGTLIARFGIGIAARLEREAMRNTGGDGRRIVETVRDVDHVANFLTGGGPPLLLDAALLPLSIALAALLHPALGLYAVGSAALIIAIARSTGPPKQDLRDALERSRRSRLQHYLTRAAEPDPVTRAFYDSVRSATRASLAAGAIGKAARLSLHALGFALGAALAIEGVIGLGALFAWSLISSKQFATLDAALAHWSGLTAARHSYLALRRIIGVGRESDIVGEAQLLRS